MDTRENHKVLTKKDFVFHILRERIISGKIVPNTKLIIRNISTELSVSAIPVREAFQRLEAEQLITIIPHTGAIVNSICISQIEEGLEGRYILEPYCAKKATHNITSQDLEKLNFLIKEMDIACENDNYEEYGKINTEFHQLIYRRSNNKTLFEIIESLWSQSERLRAVFRYKHLRMQESNAEHKSLVEALKNGDENLVESIITKQRKLSSHYFLQYLKKYELSKDHGEHLSSLQEAQNDEV